RAVLLREGLYGGECALGRQFLPDAGCDFVTEQRHRDDESEASAVSQQIETATDEKLVEILFADLRRYIGRFCIAKSRQGLQVHAGLFLRQDLVRRITNDGVEPWSLSSRCFGKEHLWKGDPPREASRFLPDKFHEFLKPLLGSD